MIYTIGHKVTYLIAMGEKAILYLKGEGDGILYKSGRTGNYDGGYAFRSEHDAQLRIEELEAGGMPSNYMVFGLRADWDTETEKADDGWWNLLLVDAEIVLLERDETEVSENAHT